MPSCLQGPATYAPCSSVDPYNTIAVLTTVFKGTMKNVKSTNINNSVTDSEDLDSDWEDVLGTRELYFACVFFFLYV